MMTGSRYEAVYREHGVTLSDREAGVEARILPEYGNRASAVRVHGTNILWFPWDDSAPIAEKPSLNGIPLLAPWGNRLDGGYRVIRSVAFAGRGGAASRCEWVADSRTAVLAGDVAGDEGGGRRGVGVGDQPLRLCGASGNDGAVAFCA